MNNHFSTTSRHCTRVRRSAFKEGNWAKGPRPRPKVKQAHVSSLSQKHKRLSKRTVWREIDMKSMWGWCDILPVFFCKSGVIFIQTQCQKRKTRPKGEDWKSWRFVMSSICSNGVQSCSIICIVFRSGRWAESISKTTSKVMVAMLGLLLRVEDPVH